MAKLRVDPTVDVVFKAILGSEEHKSLLCSFINDVLQLEGDDRVVDVTINDPFNLQKYKEDKLSIVDIKVTDGKGRSFQIDLQVSRYAGLTKRMLHNWSSIYYASLKKKKPFSTLKPVICIWLVVEDLPELPEWIPGFPNDLKESDDESGALDAPYLSFGVYCKEARRYLCEDLAIHVLQLKKAVQDGKIRDGRDRWVCFFKKGSELDPDNLPPELDTPEIREAMSIARAFTEEERKRHIYESRLSKLREQWEIEAERAQAEAALVEKDKVIFLKDAIIEEERRAKEEERRGREEERRAKEEERRGREEERRAKEDAVAELAKMRAELEALRRHKNDHGDKSS